MQRVRNMEQLARFSRLKPPKIEGNHARPDLFFPPYQNEIEKNPIHNGHNEQDSRIQANVESSDVQRLKYILTRNCTFAWNERAGVTALAAPVDDLTGELQTGEIIFNEQLESKRLVVDPVERVKPEAWQVNGADEISLHAHP